MTPYWHRFRVHLDWKSDLPPDQDFGTTARPEGFILVWHRLHLGHPHLTPEG